MDIKKIVGLAASGVIMAGCVHTTGTTPQTTVDQGQQVTTQTEEGSAMESDGVIQENTVIYSDSGFSPSTLTVEQGTTVVFVNKSSRGMWVASAVHPTHEELSELDQLTSSGNGTSYSYTFSKAGEWRYHNHVFPSDTGTVVVE